MFAVVLLLTTSERTSNVDLNCVSEDASQTDDEIKRLQQQELELIQKMLGSTASQQLDSAPAPDQLERSEEIQEDEQKGDDELQQQQQQQPNEEDIESENYSESKDAQETAEENEQQSEQQQDSEQPEMSKAQTVDSPAQGQDAQQAERRAAGQQTVHMQVHMNASPAPEKKQQVAVVHAHERSYHRAENPALSRVRNEEPVASVSRQPTVESHLSIESTSSYQLSQPSLLWRNEQMHVGAGHQNLEQQQYEQLKYQLQQQLELQRSQMEREYQLREEQMKQQMMMQWQFFTQQQQQQQWPGRAARQDSDTLCQGDPRGIASCSSFPREPDRTNVNGTCHQNSMQQVHPPHTERTEHRQAQRNYHQIRPVVVDVVSHSRSHGRGQGGPRGWPGYDGGHCRIIVGDAAGGERRRAMESVEHAGRLLSSASNDRHVCPTCGLCRQQFDMSDGKRLQVCHRAVHVVTA